MSSAVRLRQCEGGVRASVRHVTDRLRAEFRTAGQIANLGLSIAALGLGIGLQSAADKLSNDDLTLLACVEVYGGNLEKVADGYVGWSVGQVRAALGGICQKLGANNVNEALQMVYGQ